VAGSQRALGKAIGVTEQQISKIVNGGTYPFNVLNCIRLARIIDEPDWVVLRTAGKDARAIAKLLEQRYGERPMRQTVRVPDPLEGLTPTPRRYVLGLVRDLRKT
jgi:hypothetical protein